MHTDLGVTARLINEGTRIFDGDLAEKAGSPLRAVPLASQRRNADLTDDAETAGYQAQRSFRRTLKDYVVVGGEERDAGPSSLDRRVVHPAFSVRSAHIRVPSLAE
jgi:hypothetical protein